MTYSTERPDHTTAYDQFFLFGDSITEFSHDPRLGFAFGNALQNAYSRRLDIINRGFSGYNTDNAVVLFPKIFPSPQKARVRLMTVFFGANDAVLAPYGQHVPLEQYKENLKTILAHPLTKAQKTKIVIITPAPINEYQLQFFDASKGFNTPSRTASNTKIYADACRDVARSLGLPVADLWTAFMNHAGWKAGQPLVGSRDAPANELLSTLLTDGLHFTGNGYKIMYDEVIKVLQATWPEENPEKLPMVFPHWGWPPSQRVVSL